MNPQRNRFLLGLFSITLLLFNSCNESNTKSSVDIEVAKDATLKDAYASDFAIGAAINGSLIKGEDSLGLQLLNREFNSITPENIMKWMHIHPEKESFNFDLADKYVELGASGDFHTVGHTLVWHSQLADWVNSISDSVEMANVLQEHIETIVGRYKGKIKTWDVVNEALNEDGSLRETIFLKVMGESYLDKVFELAARADPQAQLAYNDYNMTVPAKRKGAIALVEKLKSKGVKVDVIGMQGHWNLNEPTLKEIEESILAYHNAGVQVHITELDITVLPNPWDLEGAEVSQDFEGSEQMNPYPQALPDSVQQQLADRYEAIFKLFEKHQDKIDRVTFWGINDGNSWLNGWPIKNRTNYPLLFDRAYRTKEAYHSVIEVKKVVH